MGIKNYIKSYFNSKSWYDAAQYHAIQAAPLSLNLSPTKALVALGLVAGTVATSQTAKNVITKPGEMAGNWIQEPIKKWGQKVAAKKSFALVDQDDCPLYVQQDTKEVFARVTNTDTNTGENTFSFSPTDNIYKGGKLQKNSKSKESDIESDSSSTVTIDEEQMKPILETKLTYQNETATWKATNAAGNLATVGAAVVGGGIVFGAFYAASNAITKISTAAVAGRSVDSVKKAAVESYHDAQALGHGYFTVFDLAGYAACRLAVDLPCYVGKEAWSQTLGRIWGQGQDEVDVSGDTSDDVVA